MIKISPSLEKVTLFSFDSFRASVKTLKVHLKNNNQKPRFDINGWSGNYEDYSKRNRKKDLLDAKKELLENIKTFLSNLNYSKIDLKRVAYYEEIRELCINNNIKLYLFNTPLHPILLKKIRDNKNTNNALNEFIAYLSSFDNFTNLYDDKDLYSEIRNFHATTHTSTNAGDIILQKVLKKEEINEN